MFRIKLEKVGSFRRFREGTVFLAPDKMETIKQVGQSWRGVAVEPHLTVANGISLAEVERIKRELKRKKIKIEFEVKEVTLFKRETGSVWQKYRKFAII